MGALPDVFPGYQEISNPDVRKKFETAWGCSLESAPGQSLMEMFDFAYKGQIKSFYIMGANPVLSVPDATYVRKALSKLEFLIVQDIFLTETAQLAHVVLPATSFAEKDGTFTNTERRVQRIRKAIEPIGNSKPDWWILGQIARKTRASGFDFEHPSQVMDEIASLTPIYGGFDYQRLEKEDLQWPCLNKNHAGTPMLHAGGFSRGKGMFTPLVYKPPVELPDDEYPLILTTGSSPYHFHTGTMTRKINGLNALDAANTIEINPLDASGLNISNNDIVRVTSRRGEITARAKLTEVSPPGVAFMPSHFTESQVNILTNPVLDPVNKTTEHGICAIKIERAV